MKRILLALAVAAAARCVCSAGERETFYLKSGAVVSGEALKERADAVVVDLGFQVLTIPRDRVIRRVRRTAKGVVRSAKGESDFYVTRRQPVATVRENVAKYGEGVALVRTPSGLGSGFLVNAKGYVVTNFHVIEGEQELTLTLFLKRGKNGFERRKIEDVKVVAVNPFLDLALLKFKAPPDLTPAPLALGRNEDVRAGQPVFAVGNPLGLERSVSEGIISTDKRSFGGLLYLQTTAAINPGNSGGPLFNMRGEVIGVTNMKAGWMTEGLSFAIPVSYLKQFLRHRDAFAFDKNNPNSGYHYLRPPRKPRGKAPGNGGAAGGPGRAKGRR